MFSRQFFQASSDVSLKIRQGIAPIEDILSQVKKDTFCVFWYIGSYGLKQGAVDYYRPHLTEVIKRGGTNCLVDLSAWAAFKDKRRDLSYVSSKGNKIKGDGVRILTCGEFFNQLKAVSAESELCTFLQTIAQREGLLDPSKDFKALGFTIGERFEENCPALLPIYALDCAKTYSLVQYIEFLFLVKDVLNNAEDITEIRFILPNDEAKYYVSSLEADLGAFLKLQNVSYASNLTVYIDCFEYGKEIFHRPYNAPTKMVKDSICFEHVIHADELSDQASLKAEA